MGFAPEPGGPFKPSFGLSGRNHRVPHVCPLLADMGLPNPNRKQAAYCGVITRRCGVAGAGFAFPLSAASAIEASSLFPYFGALT